MPNENALAPPFYLKAIADGEQAMRVWMKGRDPKSLPGDVWKCPKDCPIWHMGLSLAQASRIYAKARSGRYSEVK